MKKEKGVTLISLTIYIIGMTIVLAIISVVSGYFYTDYNATSEKTLDVLWWFTEKRW